MSGPIVVDGVTMRSIRQINALPEAKKTAIYRCLLPGDILEAFGIDPSTGTNARGDELVSVEAASGTGFVRVCVYPSPNFPDPLYLLELGDCGNNQIEVVLLVMNDPNSPRFDVDRDWQGRPTKFGLLQRNLEEEQRAMQAGLAPGQVRAGLRQTSRQLRIMEGFAGGLGHDLYLANPLGYHNAIFLEWQGFGYVHGRRPMEDIHQGFQPGGDLFRQLDASTPFRRPEMGNSVRGRSWCIHDGVLGLPWPVLEIRMFKRVGHHAGTCTYPNAAY